MATDERSAAAAASRRKPKRNPMPFRLLKMSMSFLLGASYMFPGAADSIRVSPPSGSRFRFDLSDHPPSAPGAHRRKRHFHEGLRVIQDHNPCKLPDDRSSHLALPHGLTSAGWPRPRTVDSREHHHHRVSD